ncbi:MAG: hypothetical protein ACR2MK_03625 [Solirubrobacteraceae bacterium]
MNADADLGLLRAYEPVVRYTKGELFLPTAVGPYVAHCSLWAGEADGGDPACLVSAGTLSLERLCEVGAAHSDQALSLRFVSEPLGRVEYRRWRRAPRDRLSATARFTTTGIFGRLIDAGFRGSLLLRGKVAAGLAAAAEVSYREQLETDRYTYYGRVVRDGGYVCLQYWFFYAMNDWRSTFSGVNDHEADWELVTVYLADRADGPPEPAWVAFSSHDHHGDYLRRRWDDPDLRRHGDHAVVFAGAGSHSGAFVPGDYVISVDPPSLRKVIALGRRLQRLLAPWRDETRIAAGFGIPFVDYARGDGVAIGPGHDAAWSATVIDDETPWVRDYRGLWGLDTEDPFGGERAPSGPRYERDGSVRQAWANPLGWAGLLKEPPHDDEVAELLAARVGELERDLTELDQTIAAQRAALRGLRVQVRSLQAHDYARALAESRLGETAEREGTLNQTLAARTRVAEERRTHLATLSRPIAPEPPQAHISAAQAPRSEDQQRRTRFLRAWAVVSTPLLLVAVIVILIARPLAWITTIVVLAGVFIGVEAIARRRFLSFLASTAVLAAMIVLAAAFVLLLRDHWRIALSVILGAAACALLFGNLGDLRHSWRRGPAPDDKAQQ